MAQRHETTQRNALAALAMPTVQHARQVEALFPPRLNWETEPEAHGKPSDMEESKQRHHGIVNKKYSQVSAMHSLKSDTVLLRLACESVTPLQAPCHSCHSLSWSSRARAHLSFDLL